jgi:hypothetical protein
MPLDHTVCAATIRLPRIDMRPPCSALASIVDLGAAAATNVGRDETKQQAPETKRHKGAKWIERSPA